MTMHSSSGDTFAEGLSRELAEYCALERARKSATPVAVLHPLSANCQRNLALLRSDLLHVASVMCVSASIANGIAAQPDGDAVTTSVVPFEPRFSSIGVAAAHQFIDEPSLFDVTQHWQNVCARLAFAINIPKAASQLADNRCAGVKFEIVADAWQRACGALLALHKHLAAHMASAGLTCDTKVEAVTLDMLRSAAKGGQPCIDRDGRLSVPGWAERRRTIRRSLTMPVHLEIGSMKTPATLVDVSVSGLGLETPLPIPERSRVVVWLEDGRGLEGSVSWSRHGRLGVRLACPLDAGDQLLTT